MGMLYDVFVPGQAGFSADVRLPEASERAIARNTNWDGHALYAVQRDGEWGWVQVDDLTDEESIAFQAGAAWARAEATRLAQKERDEAERKAKEKEKALADARAIARNGWTMLGTLVQIEPVGKDRVNVFLDGFGRVYRPQDISCNPDLDPSAILVWAHIKSWSFKVLGLRPDGSAA